MSEQLPVQEGEQTADESEVHHDNVDELDEVFGQPDEMEGEDEGDSGTDKEPSGESR